MGVKGSSPTHDHHLRQNLKKFSIGLCNAKSREFGQGSDLIFWFQTIEIFANGIKKNLSELLSAATFRGLFTKVRVFKPLFYEIEAGNPFGRPCAVFIKFTTPICKLFHSQIHQ